MNEIAKKILTEDYVHIIDNFLPDPEVFLSFIKNKSPQKEFNVHYPGRILHFSDEITDIFKASMSRHLNVTDRMYSHRRFRVTMDGDTGSSTSIIHRDLNAVVMVVHLQCPEGVSPEKQGTSFYEHPKLPSRRCLVNASFKQLLFQDMIMGDHYFNEWTPWFQSPLVVNRALIFDGHFYHAGPAVHSGTDIGSGRITAEVAFHREFFKELF